jgi:plasmid replication initiation protein
MDMTSLAKAEKKFVVKSNQLIEARYRLSLQESRVILWLLMQICPDDEDFKQHKIDIKEFSKMIGTEVDNQYSKLRSVTKRLVQRAIEIYDPEKKEWLQVSWLSSIKYQSSKGCVTLRFDPELKPYLLKLKNHFTKLEVTDLLQLKSIYSIKIFELLKQYEAIGKRTISVDDLRTYCGIEKKKYRNYNAIKLYVIERASAEINAKTEYEIEYKEIKESRKIVDLEWTIKKKTAFEKSQQEKGAIIRKELRSQNALIERIIEYGFSRQTAKKLIQQGTEEEISKAVKSVDLQVERGHVKNPQAMLRTAIKERWNPEVFMSKKKK